MATFTIIEINGDHISDLEGDDPNSFGSVLAAVVRNPSNAVFLERCGYHRAIRVVRQQGNPEPSKADNTCPECNYSEHLTYTTPGGNNRCECLRCKHRWYP